MKGEDDMCIKEDFKLYGRMLEAKEIADGIKSGKYRTLEDVMLASEKRSKSMETRLKETKDFNGDSSPTKEEKDVSEAIFESSLSTTTKH